MTRFMELLDDYLNLRDELKDEEGNFNSIADCRAERDRLNFLREYMNIWIDSVDARLDTLEEDEQ